MDTEYIYACRNISLNKGNGDTKRKCCAESMMSIKMCPASLNKFHILWRKIGYGNKGFIEFVCCCIVLHSLVSFSILWIASSSMKKVQSIEMFIIMEKGSFYVSFFRESSSSPHASNYFYSYSWLLLFCVFIFMCTHVGLCISFRIENKKVHKWKEKYAL